MQWKDNMGSIFRRSIDLTTVREFMDLKGTPEKHGSRISTQSHILINMYFMTVVSMTVMHYNIIIINGLNPGVIS